MSRIRSIKPEFWTSEQVMECSPLARLLFIGMWNFCDDQGVHPASTKTLRAEIFPSDDISAHQITGMISELVAQGLLVEFQADGRAWWHVTGWSHQKIDRPSRSKYPSPPKSCDPEPPDGTRENPSAIDDARRILDEYSTSPRDGREGKGGEGNRNTEKQEEVEALATTIARVREAPAPAPVSIPRLAAIPICPHEAIVTIYHEVLPELRRCDLGLELKTKSQIGWMWRAEKPGPNLDKWRLYFEYVRESDFLMRRKPGTQGRHPFECDLEWLTKPDNVGHVIAGKYHDEARHG